MESLTGAVLDFMRAHVQQYGYLLLFLLTFLETSAFLGLLAPGEAAVVIAGLFASRGPLDLGFVIPLAVVGAFLGDNTGYWLGRRFGTRVLERYGKYAFFDREALAHVRTYYASHGGKTVLLGRFTSIIRSFGPFVAGSSRMPYGPFALWSAVGCVAWGTLYSLVGYYFGESWDVIEKYLGRAGLVGFLCGVALLAGYLILRKRRARRAKRDATQRVRSRVERSGAGDEAPPRERRGRRRRRGGRNRSRRRSAGDSGGRHRGRGKPDDR